MSAFWFRSRNEFWDVVLKLGTIFVLGLFLYLFLTNCGVS